MFWLYILIAVVLFLAAIGWVTRRRGTPPADLDANVRRAKRLTPGKNDYYGAA
ncbi:hypothetical protein GON03_23135 [Nocardioides sp. MAH-18]|uniref:Uncharacterized protein n=1 Tax=Nocardioides agri TaxID=2682843 RepID=A0A6L6XZM0_9ACTN|nr:MULTISPECIES: hypothetical protein [unclassified Nocardioides]MBA2952925.1 hypothetical protein [Nocardioides sp. CGMCC 1.13656]MVQ52087.1 hypothetical protein [Nocardioides sp. MAH-18]